MANVRVQVIVTVASRDLENSETVDIVDTYSVGDNERFMAGEVNDKLAATVAKVNDRVEHVHPRLAG